MNKCKKDNKIYDLRFINYVLQFTICKLIMNSQIASELKWRAIMSFIR